MIPALFLWRGEKSHDTFPFESVSSGTLDKIGESFENDPVNMLAIIFFFFLKFILILLGLFLTPVSLA